MEQAITILSISLLALMVFINAILLKDLSKQQKEFYAEKESLIWQIERNREMLNDSYDVQEKQKKTILELEKKLRLFDRPKVEISVDDEEFKSKLERCKTESKSPERKYVHHFTLTPNGVENSWFEELKD